MVTRNPLKSSLLKQEQNILARFTAYLQQPGHRPFFLCGNAVEVLDQLPKGCIDCCMTSPPYWQHRRYKAGGIGQEEKPEDFVANLLAVFDKVRQVLKDTGSIWLNIGDTYRQKNLQGIPWRVALALMDEQGWVLRNDVIWNKVKGGPDNAKDKLRVVHEYLFHFVKQPRGYFYDDNAIRQPPKKSKVVNGRVVSATGVSGIRYRRQLELSASLTPEEREAAFAALDATLAEVAMGKIADFRMVIRKQQRTTHSDSAKVSGRAKELEQRGFYFLRYHPNGAKLGDVWDIVPEDTQNREMHFAPYPEDLCKIPLLATCPENGVVLDPFCGTGTTMRVAQTLRRKSVGIDLSEEYIESATDRCMELF